MTKIQISRAWRKLFERATRGDGYQMFGYDFRTLRMTKPGLMAAYDRLKLMHASAK